MNEAVFPLIGPLLVFGIALPLSAMLVKAALGVLDGLSRSSDFGSFLALRYSLLVGSSAIPIVWFISASAHQAETGRHVVICSALHAPGAFCPEAAGFAAVLTGLAAIVGFVRVARQRPEGRHWSPRCARGRVAELLSRNRGLRGLMGRVTVSLNARNPIATVGLVWPRVILDAGFVDALDDDALAAALLHELEHVMARDPLRYSIGSWALALNPIGNWLLRDELEQWVVGREIQCDRKAVSSGASAPALAHAVVLAARPGDGRAVALGPSRMQILRLRVELLLSYVDRLPQPASRDRGLPLLAAVLGLVLVLPHRTGTELLDVVHAASEGAAAFVVAAGN